MNYKKLLFTKENGSKIIEENLDNLKPDKGQCRIEVLFSGINYKDALGVLDQAKIFKTTPIVPGIDFVGLALGGKYKGQKVIGQGSGFGEHFDGGFSEYIVADENLIFPLPQGLSEKESMVLGTAGFTAALAIERMIINGQTKEKGPILVSGATGGVGSFSIQILDHLGFEAVALTHRPEHTEYLKSLGAKEVLNYEEVVNKNPRPLEKAKWGGVIDNLGGDFLSNIISEVDLWGNIASIGLAKGVELSTTVMPFILRGVSVLGASSANAPIDLRQKIWTKLGAEWKPKKLTELVSDEITLEQVISHSQALLEHKSKVGRTIVNLKK